jgi:hypothetical protein
MRRSLDEEICIREIDVDDDNDKDKINTILKCAYNISKYIIRRAFL